jgi:hypothetical protein
MGKLVRLTRVSRNPITPTLTNSPQAIKQIPAAQNKRFPGDISQKMPILRRRCFKFFAPHQTRVRPNPITPTFTNSPQAIKPIPVAQNKRFPGNISQKMPILRRRFCVPFASDQSPPQAQQPTKTTPLGQRILKKHLNITRGYSLVAMRREANSDSKFLTRVRCSPRKA